MKFLFALVSTLAISTAYAATIEFHIAKGTNKGAWNTSDSAIQATVGDTIRFHNDDTVNHMLHTFGAPCEHGTEMAPGGIWDCVTESPYSSAEEGPLYDHHFGEGAEVWFEVK